MRSKPSMVLFRLSQLQTSGGAKKSCESVGSVDEAGLQDEEEERAARERRSVRISWKDRGDERWWRRKMSENRALD